MQEQRLALTRPDVSDDSAHPGLPSPRTRLSGRMPCLCRAFTGAPASCRTRSAMLPQSQAASSARSASASTRTTRLGARTGARAPGRGPRAPRSAARPRPRPTAGTSSCATRDVRLDLREAGHHRGRLGERAPAERAAEGQRGGQPVAADVAVEHDQVTGLLSAERRRPRAGAPRGRSGRRRRSSGRGCRARSIRRWKPRFVMTVTATRSTPSASAQIATIWSPSTTSPFASTASIRSPSPSNAIPRSWPPRATRRLQHRRGRSHRSRR